MTSDAVLAAVLAVPPQLAAYSIGVVFVGYLVLGVSGFGSALTIVPLLALRWPLAAVVPLVLLTDLVCTLLLARLNLRAARREELAALLPGLVAGAALGAWLARFSSQPWALALLAAYVVGVALRRLRGARRPHGAGRGWAAAAGARAGVIESLYGTSGPVLVAWLARRIDDPAALRATVAPALLTVTCCALAGMAVSGQLAQALVWGAFPIVFATGLAATAVGHRLTRMLPVAWIGRIIFALLLAAGASMALHAWRQI